MKMILVFSEDNVLINQIDYKTKAIAKKQYNHFLKYGIIDSNTGDIILGAKFELI